MRPGNRLSPAQVRVLTAVDRQGYISVPAIAESAGLSALVAQHTLDALTRRSLVSPVDLQSGVGYVPTPRASSCLDAQ